MSQPSVDRTRTFLPAAPGAGDDPIFALNAEARRRAAAGEDVINATVGALLNDDGSLAVLPSVVVALDAVPAAAAAGYAPIAGDPLFTNAVVGDLLSDADRRREAIAVATPGGSGALHLAMVTLLEASQSALVPEFYWGPYETMARHSGRRLATFSMFDESGRLNLAAYERGLAEQIATQARALAILNFPCNNPTGYSLDTDEWRAIGQITAAAGKTAPVSLLVDNAYARFGAGDPNVWMEHLQPVLETGLLLVAWSGSKSFLQYGARVGALVAIHRDGAVRRELADTFSFACRGTWSNCNHRGLLGIGGILADAQQRAVVDRERQGAVDVLMERVSAFVAQSAGSGLRYPRYEGGFFVSTFTKDGEETARRLREDGIFVVPMEGAVRVALCSTPVSAVPRLVDGLTRASVR